MRPFLYLLILVLALGRGPVALGLPVDPEFRDDTVKDLTVKPVEKSDAQLEQLIERLERMENRHGTGARLRAMAGSVCRQVVFWSVFAFLGYTAGVGWGVSEGFRRVREAQQIRAAQQEFVSRRMSMIKFLYLRAKAQDAGPDIAELEMQQPDQAKAYRARIVAAQLDALGDIVRFSHADTHDLKTLIESAGLGPIPEAELLERGLFDGVQFWKLKEPEITVEGYSLPVEPPADFREKERSLVTMN